jgi:hypothetical protein
LYYVFRTSSSMSAISCISQVLQWAAIISGFISSRRWVKWFHLFDTMHARHLLFTLESVSNWTPWGPAGQNFLTHACATRTVTGLFSSFNRCSILSAKLLNSRSACGPLSHSLWILYFILDLNSLLFRWSSISHYLFGFLDHGFNASFHCFDDVKSIELLLDAFIGVGESLKFTLEFRILRDQNVAVSLELLKFCFQILLSLD